MRRGSITVFLSLILSASLVFVLVVTEASRYAGLRLTARQAGTTAADSLFASFNRDLLEDYGLLFYDGGRGTESIRCELIENDFQHYYYENANKSISLLGGSFFRIGRVDADVTEIITAVDYNGEIFVRSALDFFKYDAVSELIDRIQESLGLISEGDRVKEASEEDDKESLLEQLKPLEPVPSGAEGEEEFDHERLEDSINSSAIGAAERVTAKGWLWLALPKDKTISGKTLNMTGLPSAADRDLRKLNNSNSVFDSLTDRVLFNEYLLETFPCFVSETPESGQQYQLEYLITGKQRDDEALRAVLNKILLTREGLNMLHIFTSGPKMAVVEELTILLAGWTCIPPLIALVEVGLIAAWAFAESIMDIRILLSGGKVPLLKTEEDWNLHLSTIVQFFMGAETVAEKNDRGLCYEDYLRLQMFTLDSHDLAYRAMDMIQASQRAANPGFTMSSQIYAMEIRTTASATELFSAQPVVSSMIGYGNAAYEWEEYYSGSY